MHWGGTAGNDTRTTCSTRRLLPTRKSPWSRYTSPSSPRSDTTKSWTSYRRTISNRQMKMRPWRHPRPSSSFQSDRLSSIAWKQYRSRETTCGQTKKRKNGVYLGVYGHPSRVSPRQNLRQRGGHRLPLPHLQRLPWRVRSSSEKGMAFAMRLVPLLK